MRFRNPNLPKERAKHKEAAKAQEAMRQGSSASWDNETSLKIPRFSGVSQVERKKAKELEEKQRLAKEETLRKEKEAKQKKKEARSAAMGRCIYYL